MSIVSVAWLPLPPLLVPEIGGVAGSDDELLGAVDRAVETVLAGSEQVVVVAPTAEWLVMEGPAAWSWHGFGVGPMPADDQVVLPWQLGIGAWLLERHGCTKPTLFCGVTGPETLTPSRHLTAMLVLGDGSAKRTDKAPGHFDPAAEAWDERLAQLLEAGDATALESLDRQTGDGLMSTAAVTWPFAGRLLSAQSPTTWQGEVSWNAAPHGVGYIVATWLPLS